MVGYASLTYRARSRVKPRFDWEELVARLCNTHDFVLLQEQLLLPNELGLLNTIHPEFLSGGLSAMDVSSSLLLGRPYGGTAILYRKYLAEKLSIVHSEESRITGMVINACIGPFLLINVYLPTNYGDDESLEQYVDCLSKLEALIVETNCVHVMISGDFNCDVTSRFYSELLDFLSEFKLTISDVNWLKVCTRMLVMMAANSHGLIILFVHLLLITSSLE